MSYARIDPVADEFIALVTGLIDPSNILPKAAAKAKGKPYLLPVEIVDPPFDPATQVRTGPVYNVLADKVEAVYTVRAKTAQELADEAQARAIRTLPDPAGNSVPELRAELAAVMAALRDAGILTTP